jgi:hypothetical protein
MKLGHPFLSPATAVFHVSERLLYCKMNVKYVLFPVGPHPSSSSSSVVFVEVLLDGLLGGVGEGVLDQKGVDLDPEPDSSFSLSSSTPSFFFDLIQRGNFDRCFGFIF